jgi:serine/threonine protein kinase
MQDSFPDRVDHVDNYNQNHEGVDSQSNCSYETVLAKGPLSALVVTQVGSNEGTSDYDMQQDQSNVEKYGSFGSGIHRSSQTLELTDDHRVHCEILSGGSRQNPETVPVDEIGLSNPRNSDIRRKPPSHDTVGASNSSSIWKPRSGLTLSAFRRPENTIRLTKSDPMRRLESEYDLHCPGSSGVLGHGAYSTVRLAVRLSDGVRVAVKSIAKHEALRSRRLRCVDSCGTYKHYLEEWEILRRLHDHPYVITLIDLFETTEEIQLVTEYCQGGELFDAIQKNQRRQRQCHCSSIERQAALITSQMLQALATLHALGIVHRDVKPENILLAKPLGDDSVHVKLCDFGVARPLVPHKTADDRTSCVSSDGEVSPLTPGSRTRSFSSVGTDYYAAPELTYGSTYDTSVDIYSLGVTLYILLCGFPPVFGSTKSSLAQESSGDDDSESDAFDEVLFPGVYWNEISSNAKSLLRRMLHPIPSRRIDAKEAQQDTWIQHWIKASSPKLVSRTPINVPIDLNLVRHELYKSMIGMQRQQKSPSGQKRRNSTFVGQISSSLSPPKRSRELCSTVGRAERRSSTTALMALADLYRGVTAPSVMAAAAVVAANQTNSSMNILERDRSHDATAVNEMAATCFNGVKSPVAALSF